VTPSINAALLLASHADTLVEAFEGDVLDAYQDGNKVWTNGFGNTHGVTATTPRITQAQAIVDLKRNLLSAENDILSLVKVSLNQNMYDALVSFDYNIGPGHLKQSTTLRKLNSGDYYGAADAMLMWNEVAGKVSPGLLRRREAEKALFLA
jgi:lysozyme